MQNLSKLFFLAFLSGYFTTDVLTAATTQHNESASSGLYLDGLYDFYIEPSMESPFIFILPKGKYNLFRTEDSNSSSILETYLEKGGMNKRYNMNTGFLIFNKSDSYSNKYWEQEDAQKQINNFLNNQMTTYNVFFYDQRYLGVNKSSTVCEGSIFSPGLDSKNATTGYYFLKKYIPIYPDSYYTNRSCYLLFYSFELDYESAKEEFERISGYVHCVYNGLVR